MWCCPSPNSTTGSNKQSRRQAVLTECTWRDRPAPSKVLLQTFFIMLLLEQIKMLPFYLGRSNKSHSIPAVIRADINGWKFLKQSRIPLPSTQMCVLYTVVHDASGSTSLATKTIPSSRGISMGDWVLETSGTGSSSERSSSGDRLLA